MKRERIIDFGALVVVALAVLRSATLFAPRVFFDFDPAIDPEPLSGLGPTGSLMIDIALLAAASVVLFASHDVPRVFAVLLVVPLPILLIHAFADDSHAWQGATWAAGALSAAALAAASSDPRRRRRLAALLLAAAAPILVRGALQIEIPLLAYTGPEHAARLAQFERDGDALLADKGWETDSAAAKIFERRLTQAQPTGWFVTTNVFGTVCAVTFVACAAIGIAVVRSRQGSGAIGAAVLGAIVAGAFLWTTESKGAIGAALIGVVAVSVGRFAGRLAPWAFGAAPLFVIAAVIVRGTLLPESLGGELSLLFRAHYLEATADIVAEHPVIGVGPGGFQAAYVLHRPARSPEEVASAHGAFADWVAALGVLGLCWAIASTRLVMRGGDAEAGADTEDGGFRFEVAALAVGVAALAPALAVESHLSGVELGSRIVGIALYVVAAIGLHAAFSRLAINWILAGAAVTLLAHAQIEMTMVRPAAAVWGWALLGLAGAGAAGASRARKPLDRIFGVAALATAVVLAALALPSALRTSTALREAAAELAPLARARMASMENRQDDLRAALAELGVTDARAGAFVARCRAADRLQECGTSEARRIAARQNLRAAAAATESTPALARLDLAMDGLRPLLEADDPAAFGLAFGIGLERHRIGGAPLEEAIPFIQRLTELDPHGLTSWLRYADALWDAGRADDAREAYVRVLEIDADFELDPLKQLPDGDRWRVEARQ